MGKTVADGLWEMLVAAGVRRCSGIVGDALNPTIDAMRRNGSVDFVHVRHGEFGVFAAVADASLTDRPAVVCGTAGPGTAHLITPSPCPPTWPPRPSRASRSAWPGRCWAGGQAMSSLRSRTT